MNILPTPLFFSITRSLRLFASAVIMAGTSAIAANTWDGGGGDGNWSTNNNWDNNLQPTYGTLTFSGSTRTTNADDNITAENKLLWTGTSAWTLNQGGATVLSLFDNGGTQAKIENQSTGLVTINLPITFAANNGTPPNPFGEINAVNGDITFGTGTLTVNGSSVNGIKFFGAGHTTTFNNTVSATGKWFGLTGTGTTMAVGGTFTSGDIYVMNSGTLKLNSGGAITTTAIRLGGDFGNTGNQNQTLGGTFQLTVASGGQSFGNTINTVTGNTSDALLVDSTNTSGTNTLSGNIFLDSNLKIQQASGGTLSITSTTLDVKAQTLSLRGAGNINISSVISNSVAGGQLVIGADGIAGGPVATLSNANTYSGQTFVRAGTLAFTSAGSVANSTIRFGSTTGTNVDATINLTTATGGTTISSTINPVTTSGSGTLTLNSQNTSGTNTLSGHFGLDRNLTVTQSSGGLLDITQAHTDGGTNLTGADIKAFTLSLGGAGSINFNDVYNGTGTGTGNVVMNGSGTVTLQGTHDNISVATTVNSGTLVYAKTSSGTVHATAAVTVAGGTAKLGGTGGDQIFDSSAVTVTSGALDLNDRTETIATLNVQGSGISSAGALLNSGSSSSTLTTTTTNLTGSTTLGATGSGASVVLSGGAANVNSSNQILTQSGSGGGVVVAGPGTVTFSGANTYT
ncbi:MAG: beta strand repeat-containing protein, partial [Chthoniobacterales bacterium]